MEKKLDKILFWSRFTGIFFLINISVVVLAYATILVGALVH